MARVRGRLLRAHFAYAELADSSTSQNFGSTTMPRTREPVHRGSDGGRERREYRATQFSCRSRCRETTFTLAAHRTRPTRKITSRKLFETIHDHTRATVDFGSRAPGRRRPTPVGYEVVTACLLSPFSTTHRSDLMHNYYCQVLLATLSGNLHAITRLSVQVGGTYPCGAAYRGCADGTQPAC